MEMTNQNNLLRLILEDFRKQIVTILIMLMLFCSALYKVYITHDTRVLITKKDKLSQQQDQLRTEWESLQLEENTFAEHSRVRRIAMKQLSMIQPNKSNTVLVEL